MPSLASDHTATKLLRDSSAHQPAEEYAGAEKHMHRDDCRAAHPDNQLSASSAEQPANRTSTWHSTNAKRRSKSERTEKKIEA